MLRTIPPDNISNETREDLIKIHALAKGIAMRYQNVEKKTEDPKKGADQAKADEQAAPAPPPTEFKLDEVKPAFADIFSVCEPGLGP